MGKMGNWGWVQIFEAGSWKLKAESSRLKAQ